MNPRGVAVGAHPLSLNPRKRGEIVVIVRAAPGQHVIARAAVERIIAEPTDENITASVTVELIITRLAEENVVPAAAVENIVAIAAVEECIAGNLRGNSNRIITGQAVDENVSGKTECALADAVDHNT